MPGGSKRAGRGREGGRATESDGECRGSAIQRAEGQTLHPVGHLGEDGREEPLGKVGDRGRCSCFHQCTRAEPHFCVLRCEEKRFRSYQVMVLASDLDREP